LEAERELKLELKQPELELKKQPELELKQQELKFLKLLVDLWQ
jgi:hypothetical protein